MKIKVTGYLNTEDLDPEHLDPNDETGLTEEGFLYWSNQLNLDDCRFNGVG